MKHFHKAVIVKSYLLVLIPIFSIAAEWTVSDANAQEAYQRFFSRTGESQLRYLSGELNFEEPTYPAISIIRDDTHARFGIVFGNAIRTWNALTGRSEIQKNTNMFEFSPTWSRTTQGQLLWQEGAKIFLLDASGRTKKVHLSSIPQWLLYDGRSHRLIYENKAGRVMILTFDSLNKPQELKGYGGGLAVSPFLDDTGSFLFIPKENGKLLIADLDQGSVTESVSIDTDPLYAWYVSGKNLVSIVSATGIETIDLIGRDRQRTRYDALHLANSQIIDAVGYNILVKAHGTYQVLSITGEKFKIPDTGIKGASFMGNLGAVLTLNNEGEAKVWGFSSKVLLLQIFSADKGWVAITPKGKFDAESGSLPNIKVTTKVVNFDISKFSDKFFEPGLIRKAAMEKYFEIDSAINISESFLPPPMVKLGKFREVEVGRLQLIEFDFDVFDMGGGIKEVRVFHNGHRLPPRNEQFRKEKLAKQLKYTSRFVPIAGKNVIRIEGSSIEGLFGPDDIASLKISKPKIHPTLHLLTMAINKYREPFFNLNYAVADADEIEKVFTSHLVTGHTLSPVKLRNKQFTKRQVLRKLEEFSHVAPEDTVVIYIASHGEIAKGEFYILPYEMPLIADDDNIEKYGISMSNLGKNLQKISASRVLLLIDACKSGGAVRHLIEETTRKVFARFGKALGLHILSATTQDQLAKEVKNLGHGVFTYSVVKGIEGEADISQEGNISIKELSSYVGTEVPKLSEKHSSERHTPMYFTEGFDFIISQK